MTEQTQKITELLMQYLMSYGMNVLGAIVTLIAGYIIAGWLARLRCR